MNLEQQTMIKEAIITKATSTLENASKSGTSFSQGFTNKVFTINVNSMTNF